MAKRKAEKIETEHTDIHSVVRIMDDAEDLFRIVYEQSPIGICITREDHTVADFNEMYRKILGRSEEELRRIRWEDFTHPDDIAKDLLLFAKFQKGEIENYTIPKRYVKPDGTIIWANVTISSIKVNNTSKLSHLCLIEDITERVATEQSLLESERSKSVMMSNLPGMAYRCKLDRDWTMLFVSDGCFELTGYEPCELLGNANSSFNDLILPSYREYLWGKWKEILVNKEKLKEEYEIQTKTGEMKWVYEQGQGIYDDNGEVVALEGLIVDITALKRKEEEVRYLTDHDYMTGAFNRSYMDKAKELFDSEEYLPLTIMIGDVNGIKFVNNTFGIKEGDELIIESAKILKSCCSKSDILARTGGDEFSILMPNTDEAAANEKYNSIKEAFEAFNGTINREELHLKFLMGYGTKTLIDQSLDLLSKTAKELVDKRKLLERKSSQNALVESIKATMLERSKETDAHGERLSHLTNMIAKKINLSEIEQYELEIFAILHDLGKVGIDDRILLKPGKLTDDEWKEMRKHPEIGYRIAMSSPELSTIADYILSHHERWDGTGYPRGLQGEAIPLLSRILAVADAFDAMTEDRIYRKAMPKDDAIAEIKRNSGGQFDPIIVDNFIKAMT